MIAGITAILLLGGWHLNTRRHRLWRHNRDARFFITTGYPIIAIAVYFLTQSPKDTDWEWALGCLWALVAAVSFVYGFQLLNAPVSNPERTSAPSEPVWRRARHSV